MDNDKTKISLFLLVLLSLQGGLLLIASPFLFFIDTLRMVEHQTDSLTSLIISWAIFGFFATVAISVNKSNVLISHVAACAPAIVFAWWWMD